MAQVIVSDYFYGDESKEFSYFRIPRLLITHQRFKNVSTEAKLLYGLLLDRMGLSEKHDGTMQTAACLYTTPLRKSQPTSAAGGTRQ